MHGRDEDTDHILGEEGVAGDKEQGDKGQHQRLVAAHPAVVFLAFLKALVLHDLHQRGPEELLDELSHSGSIGHLAPVEARGHAGPQLPYPAEERVHRDAQGRQHDDVDKEHVLGEQEKVPVAEELRVADLGELLARGQVHAAGDHPHEQHGQGGNGDQKGQILPGGAQPGQGLRPTEGGVHIGADGAEHIPGPCAPRAHGGAVAAVVTEKNIGIVDQLLLGAPLRKDHLAAREGAAIGRQRAGNRTGRTLVALFQRITARLLHGLDKFTIWLHIH